MKDNLIASFSKERIKELLPRLQNHSSNGFSISVFTNGKLISTRKFPIKCIYEDVVNCLEMMPYDENSYFLVYLSETDKQYICPTVASTYENLLWLNGRLSDLYLEESSGRLDLKKPYEWDA
jgi:hypothetical protein